MVFCSVYEITDAICTVRKSHMVCWFSGDTLHNRWTTDCHTLTSTFQMADVICGGFEIVTSTTSTSFGHIHYCDIRHYNECSSVFIAVVTNVTSTADTRVAIAPTENQALTAGFSELGADTTRNCCFFTLTTFCGVCGTCITSLCEAIDLCEHTLKIEHNACDVEGSIDTCACVCVTATTNLPNDKLQPEFLTSTRTSAARTGRIRYFEAFNK